MSARVAAGVTARRPLPGGRARRDIRPRRPDALHRRMPAPLRPPIALGRDSSWPRWPGVPRGALFDPGRGALVMVSGGQDSLALLHLLATGRLGNAGRRGVRALHVNHHLRGADSDADEALVRAHCAALGVELTVVDAPVDKRAGNLQARAREARREAALTSAATWGSRRVALAHTLDDQVETMLYRLGRYGGLAALAGHAARVAAVGAAASWACAVRRPPPTAGEGLRWAVDRGNDDPGYARTALRVRGCSPPGRRRCPARSGRPPGRPAWPPRPPTWSTSGSPRPGVGPLRLAASAGRRTGWPPRSGRRRSSPRSRRRCAARSFTRDSRPSPTSRSRPRWCVGRRGCSGRWDGGRGPGRRLEGGAVVRSGALERTAACRTRSRPSPTRLARTGSVHWGPVIVDGRAGRAVSCPRPDVEAYLDADA